MADPANKEDTEIVELSAVECDVCGNNHITEDCPMLGLSTSDFKAQISRSRLTVPHYLGVMDYPDGEVGIIAVETISNKTQLGPFEAKKTCHCPQDDVFILKILSPDGNTICLDASSENHCNWMALVQVATTEEEQNCIAYQLGINIYFNTTRDIPAGTALKVWYASKYAQKLGKPPTPDGKTRSMLGLDISTWQNEDPPTQSQASSNEGLLEAYLSVLPSPASSASDGMETILIKQESGQGDQVYSCSKCHQLFFSQSDYAIHLRGHLMPTSLLSHARGGKRGRPWGRAGVITPLGKRGPGRPKKMVTSWTEPGELMAKTSGSPKKRGRPRKVQPAQTAGVNGAGGGETVETGAAGSAEQASSDVTQSDRNAGESIDGNQPSTEHTETEVPDMKSQTGSETCQTSETKENETLSGVKKGTEGKVSETEGKHLEPSAGGDQNSGTTSLQTADPAQTLVQGSPQVPKTPKRRGRPPKNKNPVDKEESSMETKPSSSPTTSASLSSRRVQPRRTLKGKRTSTFRYPGESSSEEDEEDKVKAKNVLKQALKVKEYSDDDDDDHDEYDDRGQEREEGELEPGEVVGEGMQITVQMHDGLVLAKAPVILLDQDTGHTQTLDPATLSLVSTGVDSSGQEVMVLQSTPATTTTTTTATIVMSEGEDIAVSTNSTSITATTNTSTTTTTTTNQSQTTESSDTPENGLATLVDAALLTQKMDKGEAVDKEQEKMKEEEGGQEEDVNSDDPDWKGPVTLRRDGTPRKRRPKRRKGDDPDLEQLEESIQVVDGPSGTKEYACGVCSKRFQQLKYLKMHLPAHTDKFLCNDCGRRFARHESLQKHVCEDWLVLVEKIESEEDGSILFRCKECGRSFPQKDHARRHASMHRGTWACSKCQRTFPKRQLLLEHQCKQEVTDVTEIGGNDSNSAINAPAANNSGGEGEGEGGDFPCDICQQSFSNAKYLFRHMAMHTELFKCPTCSKCYSRKDSLQRHVLKCCPHLADDYSVFACEKCKKTFGTRLGLENHVLNCGRFQCAECRIAYFNEEDLAQHKCEGKIIDDAAGVQFPCKECGKTFASLPYLARHEASHHGAFECAVCNKVFVRKEELAWHSPVCEGSNNIEREGVTSCKVCNTQFTDGRLFREHFQVHTHPYRCDKCGKRFIKVGTLHTHKCDNVVAGTEEEGVWQCDICEKTFKNERYLARHKQLHGLPSFDCEYCGKKFIRKDYLNDHKCVLPDGTSVRVVRKKNRLYIRDDLVCPQCNKTFSSRSNLNKHMRSHGAKEAECHICGKKFHYHNYLKMHIATVHDRQFQYQCSHCGKILYSKTGLIAHIKQFHQETVKLFACPQCGKTFRQKGNMRTHLYSHTKEKTFQCQLCSKAFKYPDQLNRHRLEHTLSEKIKCNYCDKRFVRASELRQHERLFHSGVIYTCHVCHESCAHKHTIVRHYRRKHPELADVFDKQPDFLDTLQKPVDKTTQSLPTQRLPIQLTPPSREGEQKPRIIRVLAEGGQEQDYIITTSTPLSEASTVPVTTAATEVSTLQVGDQVLPYATLTTEQVQDVLPQEAVQVLQDLSGTVYETDGQGVITQTMEDVDGNQTVIILQVVNQDEMDSVQEVTHIDGEQISIQEITTDLGIEVPMEITTANVNNHAVAGNVETVSYTTDNITETDTIESVVIDASSMDTVPDGTITLVTSALAPGVIGTSTMEGGVMVTSAMETVDTLETPTVVNTVVEGNVPQEVIRYL